MPINTEALGRAQVADREAFDGAILPLQGSLMRLALGLTHDASDARDLVQDALERAVREWARFTPGTNARAWVSAILSRLFIDRWRRRKRQPRFVDLERAEAAGEGISTGHGRSGTWGAPPDAEAAPLHPWEAVSEADLAAAVAELPAKLRAVFALNATGSCSYVDISLAVGIPVNTVGTRLLRARRTLRASLERRLAAPERSRNDLSVAGPTVLVAAPSTEWAPPLQVGSSPARAAARRAIAAPAGNRGRPRAPAEPTAGLASPH